MCFFVNWRSQSKALVGLLCCSLAQAAVAAEATEMRSGTFACAGNHFARVNGSELHRTVYVLSNPNRDVSVTLDRMRVFDANGKVLFDFPDDALPTTVKTELDPYETTQINSFDILTDELSPEDRPMQTHIEWSTSGHRRALPPSVGLVRTVRDVSGPEKSRASADCRLIRYQR